MTLWSVNNVLRWTGFRLTVEVWDGKGEWKPTKLYLRWWGNPLHEYLPRAWFDTMRGPEK